MLPVNIGFDPAASLNASCPALKGSGADAGCHGAGLVSQYAARCRRYASRSPGQDRVGKRP